MKIKKLGKKGLITIGMGAILAGSIVYLTTETQKKEIFLKRLTVLLIQLKTFGSPCLPKILVTRFLKNCKKSLYFIGKINGYYVK